MEEPAIDKETLRRMAREFGAMPLTEDDLDAAVPIVQAYARAARQFAGVDLSGTISGRVICLYPRGDDDES